MSVKRPRTKKDKHERPVVQAEPMTRPLSMPTYEYQEPSQGSFVSGYNEQSQVPHPDSELPALQNFVFGAA